jgi:opacity protein-like surface antigen
MQLMFLERNLRSVSAILCGTVLALAGAVGTVHAGLFNVPAEPADWNGIYMGFNAGVAWDHYDVGPYSTALNLDGQFNQIIAMLPEGGKPTIDGQGQFIEYFGYTSFYNDGHSDTDVAPIGGLHFGYNKQFGHFVAGLEFGFEGTQTSKGSESRSFQANFPILRDDEPLLGEADTYYEASRRAERNWDGWVGGQLGFAWGRFLFYGKGGYTFADVGVYAADKAKTGFYFGQEMVPDQPIGGFIGGVSSRQYTNASDIMNGWFAGGGTLFALNDKVAIGLEYRHSDFGDEVFRFHPAHPIYPGATRVDLSSDQVEFLVNIMLGHLGH